MKFVTIVLACALTAAPAQEATLQNQDTRLDFDLRAGTYSLSTGDTLVIRHRGRQTTARVARVPERAPSKADAPTLYEIVSVEPYE